MWMSPKDRGKTPKMDGENFMENPMNKWMIWGFSHYFWVDTRVVFGCGEKTQTGCGFKYFLLSPLFGEMIQFD